MRNEDFRKLLSTPRRAQTTPSATPGRGDGAKKEKKAPFRPKPKPAAAEEEGDEGQKYR